jgi:zinc D-Ala-D-Ala carboxypeptidase
MKPLHYLTPHFTLEELTHTSVKKFQEENRKVTANQIRKLTDLAGLLEHVRFILQEPVFVSSGYRCPGLNQAVGSTVASQHLRCEAADFTVESDLEKVFRFLWDDIKEHGTNVGQLIMETAKRPYGVASWLHISLGIPYRHPERCKQILRMTDGKYEVLA